MIAAVEYYFWGRQYGDQDQLAQAFDLENGHMKFVRQEDGVDVLNAVTLADFAARLDSPISSDTQGRVLTIDVVDGKMAFVKALLEGENRDFVDYLLLYKRNGEWRIVNKMFVVRSHN